MPRAHLTPIVPLLAAALVACGDGAAGAERGTYVLRTVGDSTIPFVEYAQPGNQTTLVADTIALDGRGGARRVTVLSQEWTGTPPTTYRTAYDVRYSMRRDTVEFVFVCPPGASCVRQLAGYRLTTGGISTFALDPQYPVAVSVFERVR